MIIIFSKKELAKMIRADGWYYTGDVGYYDADGHIFILGRISELIIYKSKYVKARIISNTVKPGNLRQKRQFFSCFLRIISPQ